MASAVCGFGEQQGGHVLVEIGVVAAEPLQQHAGVLDFLAHVVTQDPAQGLVPAGVRPLLVTVHGFDLFTQ